MWVIVNQRLVHVEQGFTTMDEALIFIIDHRLSSPAHLILRHAPPAFRNGQIISIRLLADLIGYPDSKRVRQGLIELAGYGFVQPVTFGHRGRHRYQGIPSLMWSSAVQRLFSTGKTRAA